MSFQFLLEDNSGNYQLEDGSGNYLQDIPTKVVSSTVGLTENSSKFKTIIKAVTSTLGLTEARNYFTGLTRTVTQALVALEGVLNKKVTFDVYTLEDDSGSYLLEDGSGLYKQDIPTKVISSTVGMVEASNYIRGLRKVVSSTVGLTESVNKVFGFVRMVAQSILNLQGTNRKIVRDANIYGLEDGLGNYLLEDGTGFYLIDNLLIVRNATTSTLGLSDAYNQIDGTVHNILSTVGLTEGILRLRDLVRIFVENLGLLESLSLRWTIGISEIVGVTESVNRARVMFRNISSTVGLTEATDRLRNIVRTFNEIVGLTDVVDIVKGIIKEAIDTVGLIEAVKRIRIVRIDYSLGDFVATALINLNSFIITSLEDVNDFTVVDSLNSGDFIISDDV